MVQMLMTVAAWLGCKDVRSRRSQQLRHDEHLVVHVDLNACRLPQVLEASLHVSFAVQKTSEVVVRLSQSLLTLLENGHAVTLSNEVKSLLPDTRQLHEFNRRTSIARRQNLQQLVRDPQSSFLHAAPGGNIASPCEGED